jgi:ABC-type multidrug transport system fused ATPase/permease subunit
MKRLFRRAVSLIAFITASVVGGWWMGKALSSFSFEIPYWLDVAIRAGMHLAGIPDPLDPEDIETIGLFALWLAYSLVVAAILGGALFQLRRYLKKRRACSRHC